ncbi:YagK/YfjJ domain-containing protein [Vibrio parahaemolyticus]|uniref:YagK/YfjJ domain-containing protein n=1 Tax=Vibrio harveyi group TaxID=717610 RepID=UPI0013E2BB42|nr:inovirus-type Gp2 protein [Vibrio parahaemolyticus]EHK0753074.1 inovirus-type Gp2 protein [Vibrio parahaemolyticus]EHR5320131.1 inovirus-type Gp2 protein [Vibrio parahaemolyticus]EJB8454288.1 inovirus-type Gp2 protein [Vibrio parahaemolyticus]MBD6982808.1 inovirus-type Gp2 protein [Vibrio parahaemolyticus]MBD6985892.1 inovirus-type Gp2 protein [Vibrio parahaemolyticus]
MSRYEYTDITNPNPSRHTEFSTKTKGIQETLNLALSRYKRLSVLLIELVIPPDCNPYCNDDGESLMHALMDTLQQSINDFADGFHEEGQLHGVWELEKMEKVDVYALALMVSLDWMRSHSESHQRLNHQIQKHWQQVLSLSPTHDYHDAPFLMVAPKQDELVIDQVQSFLIAQKQVNMAYKRILNHLSLDRPTAAQSPLGSVISPPLLM